MATGYVFPGQGSQFPGMGKDLYEKYADVREIYERAKVIAGFNVAEISFEADKETLSRTQYTQPCIFVHSFAALTAMARKAQYDAVAGHSLGEYCALVAAKSISFEDGLAALAERGRLMAAAKEGTMLAPIGASLDDVQSVVADLQQEGIIEIANYNAPGQFVISGEKAILDKAAEMLKSKGVKKVVPLAVSGAFHSPLMAEAAKEMEKMLATIEFRAPQVAFYANVTGDRVENPQEIRKNLVLQLTSSVQWIKTIESMMRDGHSSFVEVGPGKVLQGLIKRIAESANAVSWDAVQ